MTGVRGQMQERNPDQVRLLSTDFITREEFFADEARILSAVLMMQQGGGSNLRWGWLGDSDQLFGEANTSSPMGSTGISSADYFATNNGGPYVDFNGTTEYFSEADNAWQEPTTRRFLVWTWANIDNYTGDMTIASKWDASTNERAWRLWFNNAAGVFTFSTSVDGTAVVSVASTYTESLDTWYFVAGWFVPSTRLRIYVAAATELALTQDTNAVATPASIFNGTEDFMIGASDNGAGATDLWDGSLGIQAGRLDIPNADVDAYVTKLFGLTRYFYQA